MSLIMHSTAVNVGTRLIRTRIGISVPSKDLLVANHLYETELPSIVIFESAMGSLMIMESSRGIVVFIKASWC